MASKKSKELKGGAAHVKKQQDSFSVGPQGSNEGKVFHIHTIHISSKSDPYLDDEDKKYNYGGIIIYACKGEGEKEWRPILRKNAGIGYVVIMETDSVKFKGLQTKWPNEPGKVHGIIFRKALGKSCKKMNVVGEGFSIMSGRFETTSGVFNPSHGDVFHDESLNMHSVSAECVEKVVEKWKKAGKKFTAQNYLVKSLFSPDNN